MEEQFRKVAYSTYGLDSAHYYTCSDLSGDAFLKVSEARVELLTDRSHLEMAENLIRRGVSSVFSKRLATMNNKYLEWFDETKPTTYGLLLNANNLYGGNIQNFPLPLSEFEIVDVELSSILLTANDSGIGFVLEVDLDYPDDLHTKREDFALAPTKDKIDRIMLSKYQMGPLDQAGIRCLYRLYSRRKITRFITFYVDLGLKVSKVHRVLQFKQKRLEPYVNLNTRMQIESKNKFEESFCKLMDNYFCGKTSKEAKRGQRDTNENKRSCPW